jgi:sugar lactone lactonase YvrE
MRKTNSILILALTALAIAFFAIQTHAYSPRYSPSEIAVDDDGNIYTIMNVDSLTGEGVFVYATNGTELTSIRRPGCTDVAIDSRGIVYVLNIGQKRVERMEKNGTFSVVWREDDPDRFISYFTTDGDGNLLVSDYNYSSATVRITDGYILKITPDGRVADVIESNPTYQLNLTFKMAVGGNGTIYLSNFSRSFTAIYPDGNWSTIIHTNPDNGTFGQVAEVSAGDDGYLYVGIMSNGSVRKLTTDGTLVARWDGCGPEPFASPVSIVAKRDGRVYVCDMQNQRIVWFDSTRYQFGDNATENLAGRGVLWDSVIAGDNYTIALDQLTQPAWGPMGTPGFDVTIALAGLGLAGAFLCFGRARKG